MSVLTKNARQFWDKPSEKTLKNLNLKDVKILINKLSILLENSSTPQEQQYVNYNLSSLKQYYIQLKQKQPYFYISLQYEKDNIKNYLQEDPDDSDTDSDTKSWKSGESKTKPESIKKSLKDFDIRKEIQDLSEIKITKEDARKYVIGTIVGHFVGDALGLPSSYEPFAKFNGTFVIPEFSEFYGFKGKKGVLGQVSHVTESAMALIYSYIGGYKLPKAIDQYADLIGSQPPFINKDKSMYVIMSKIFPIEDTFFNKKEREYETIYQDLFQNTLEISKMSPGDLALFKQIMRGNDEKNKLLAEVDQLQREQKKTTHTNQKISDKVREIKRLNEEENFMNKTMDLQTKDKIEKFNKLKFAKFYKSNQCLERAYPLAFIDNNVEFITTDCKITDPNPVAIIMVEIYCRVIRINIALGGLRDEAGDLVYPIKKEITKRVNSYMNKYLEYEIQKIGEKAGEGKTQEEINMTNLKKEYILVQKIFMDATKDGSNPAKENNWKKYYRQELYGAFFFAFYVYTNFNSYTEGIEYVIVNSRFGVELNKFLVEQDDILRKSKYPVFGDVYSQFRKNINFANSNAAVAGALLGSLYGLDDMMMEKNMKININTVLGSNTALGDFRRPEKWSINPQNLELLSKIIAENFIESSDEIKGIER
jgi:hypothetical protein